MAEHIDENHKTLEIVLCQGLSGEKHKVLPLVANAFASAGYVVLAFDYGGSGQSEDRRNCPYVFPAERVEDALCAITYVEQLPCVNPKQIGLYGISCILGCSIIIHGKNNDTPSKNPIEVVNLFFETYGTSRMDEIGPYTTAKFRGNKPMSVWVVKTWNALKQMEYERLKFEVLDSKITDKNALVAVQSKIKAVAGEADQKEIYSLILENNRWLIDDLVVTDEEIDLEKIKI